MNTTEKKAYVKPVLNRIGSFEDVTLGGACGAILDADFPRGSPIADLTCS